MIDDFCLSKNNLLGEEMFVWYIAVWVILDNLSSNDFNVKELISIKT